MTPADAGLHQPAEWQRHAATWVAWPWDASLWGDHLPGARREWAALCRAIGEPLEVLVPDAIGEAGATEALDGVTARFHRVPYGDIWVRDTLPIFLTGGASVRFTFDGWGRKYMLPGDPELAATVAVLAGGPTFRSTSVLEGGSVDVDGEGTVLTTRQCLLDGVRNPGLTEADAEALLGAMLGAERVVWLDHGLVNDHTDGHVDTLARFVAPGVVVCMAPSYGDPNAAVLDDVARSLDRAGLDVVRVPSPGLVTDGEGRPLPASHVNFFVANDAVVVPTYCTPHDPTPHLAPLFPGRRVIGLPARHLITGGGAFHCVTQQVPEVSS